METTIDKTSIRSAKEALVALIETFTARHGVEVAFRELSSHLGGFNVDEGSDESFFDFNYGDIASTIFYRGGTVVLCDVCDVWDSDGIVKEGYEW